VAEDRFSKLRHFIPCDTTIDAVGMAKLFLQMVVNICGLPATIVSDRRPKFASTFWGKVCSCWRIAQRKSTAVHPRTVEQTKWMNASMKQYLRVLVNHQYDDWVQWLPLAEFAANIGISESTKCTTFMTVQETDPRM